MSAAAPLDLAGLPIVVLADDHATARHAAAELGRYLYRLSGQPGEVRGKLPRQGDVIVLDGDRRLGEQSYRLSVKRRGSFRSLSIGAADAVGLLYGVYGLLERLGMGFYNGGDGYPDLPAATVVPGDLDVTARPAFTARGNMLHYNFLCGCTNWGLDDYKYYFDQLARQRMNVLLMHWYDGEPGAAHEYRGEYVNGGRAPSSLSKPWGALAALRTSEFAHGTGRCFDEEVWTGPAGDGMPDPITEIKQAEGIFAAATRYAAMRGVRVAAGFEAPGKGDPTDPATIEQFRDRIRQFVARNPELTYFALWQHESGGCTGNTPPPAESGAGRLLASQRERFAFLGNQRRIWEAIRYGEFARLAAAELEQCAPQLRLVVVGWGGDRWMRFADYCLVYDTFLPSSVIFTCHDNIDASMGPNVSTPWGQLPASRERWAMPWVEGDLNDCWTRQAHVEDLGKLAPDALAKGCQGLLNLQWRTRDIEEENGYIAQFAWDTQLTPDAYYRRLACHTFGSAHEAAGAELIGGLHRLGSRWTGVQGTAECSRMTWTGWEPHFPFEFDAAAPAFLAPLADEMANVLSRVPAPEDDPQAGAFHVRTEAAAAGASDPSRFGVARARELAGRLRALEGQTDLAALRQALQALHEDAYALRYELVTQGMAGPGYRAVDHFLLALHHIVYVAGYGRKSDQVRRYREQLESLRAALPLHRQERVEFLAASMEFVLHLDAVATLLADGEAIETAVARATAAPPAVAAELAAGAYGKLIEAGMREALLAQTRKLTTRCEWGVLTTLNVKPMPKYWEAVGRLETFLPAVPPRELTARGLAGEVWLSWTGAKAAGLHLWRRPVGGSAWSRLGKAPLAGGCTMYIDRPGDGRWEYAVSALGADGFESPRSHAAAATCGLPGDPPRILATMPFTQSQPGEPWVQRAVVLADRELVNVSLVYRTEFNGDWWSVPMHHRFRDSWQGVIPGDLLTGQILEYFVEAETEDGARATWPAAAEQGHPWSVTIVD